MNSARTERGQSSLYLCTIHQRAEHIAFPATELPVLRFHRQGGWFVVALTCDLVRQQVARHSNRLQTRLRRLRRRPRHSVRGC